MRRGVGQWRCWPDLRRPDDGAGVTHVEDGGCFVTVTLTGNCVAAEVVQSKCQNGEEMFFFVVCLLRKKKYLLSGGWCGEKCQ